VSPSGVPSRQLAAAARRAPGRVLIVDDNPGNRLLVGETLRAEGHDVVEADSGEECLACLARSEPDAVLLDVMMAGIDGYEVCRRIKSDAATHALPVLLLTALHDRDSRVRGIAVGADEFLSKPIDTRELALRVRNAVHAGRLYNELRRRYEELSDLEWARDGLMGMVVHDMRSPLGALDGHLDLARRRMPDPPPPALADHLEAAATCTAKLVGMVESLAAVRDLEQGRMKLQRLTCDLRTVLHESVLAAAAPDESSCRPALDLPDEAVTADCDPDVVGRVVMNLVQNAVKFTPPAGRVCASVREHGDEAVIRVSDDGPGIPAADHERIFERFVQLSPRPGVRPRRGLGLGLAFCRAAVDLHGGRIEVESECGRGTTFAVHLPKKGPA